MCAKSERGGEGGRWRSGVLVLTTTSGSSSSGSMKGVVDDRQEEQTCAPSAWCLGKQHKVQYRVQYRCSTSATKMTQAAAAATRHTVGVRRWTATVGDSGECKNEALRLGNVTEGASVVGRNRVWWSGGVASKAEAGR